MENETKNELITGGSAKKNRVLIMGTVGHGASALMMAEMIEKFGKDVIIVTPEEANEQGLTERDFANILPMKITAPPIIEMPTLIGGDFQTGKEKRRARRKQERSKAR